MINWKKPFHSELLEHLILKHGLMDTKDICSLRYISSSQPVILHQHLEGLNIITTSFSLKYLDRKIFCHESVTSSYKISTLIPPRHISTLSKALGSIPLLSISSNFNGNTIETYLFEGREYDHRILNS